MRHYCTLFNMAYAAKGMELYYSLRRHSSKPFTLWVLAMDYKTYGFLNVLRQSGLPHMNILSPNEIIAGRLQKAVEKRDVAYTCFTTTPWLMAHLLDTYSWINEITYLDADLGFFSDPEKAHAQIPADKAVAIVPHRFLPHDIERLKPSGQFNVSWVTIRYQREGIDILKRWVDECLSKCDRESCGDQFYLNAWPELLGDKLHIFSDHGVGMAPWNADRYDIVNGTVPLLSYREGGQDKGGPLTFYHFHELKRRGPGDYFLTGYELPDSCMHFIYEPYLAQLERHEALIENIRRYVPC